MILDITMPNFNGIDALAALASSEPGVGVLMYSGLPEENFALSMLHKGADGYLNKECEPEQIVDAIRTIANSRQYVSPTLDYILQQHLLTAQEGHPHEQLSARELQVFIRLAKEESLSEIGNSLGLSEKTVAGYRQRTLAKLKLTSDSELIYYAVKYNLVD
ncbi:LuxR C-terminal-related transcriptional regulator [Acidovorax sp.]|uniref:LuxR C-terminal-related transcriptional regulator n=1 Tax=Acidovorax sp. TaxID=1872122 RepID=UPI00391F8BFD